MHFTGERTLPQVINGLGNELVNLVTLSIPDEIAHLTQLSLKVLDASVAHARHHTRLQNHVDLFPDEVEVAAELAHNVIPQLEAGMAGHTLGEQSGVPTGALVTLASCRHFTTLTCARHLVTLSRLGTQRVAVTLWQEGEKEIDREGKEDQEKT